MSDRFPGGVISKTPPTVVAPVDGEGGSASGVWTLAEQLGLQKAGVWPQKVLPRELYAWGKNTNGAVGDNTTINRSSPVQVGALVNWKQVSVGYSFSGSVKTDNSLWMWGNNGSRQLGQNNAIYRSSPVQVGALTNWKQLALGPTSSACVKTDNTLWTWGGNSSGQLAQNNTTVLSSPVQVGTLANWNQVSSTQGGSGGCAAVKTDGTLWTWGDNGYGRLGTNQSAATRNSASSPVQVGGLTTWQQVSCGSQHTVAITTAGALYAWGRNDDGQLGQNSTLNRSSPVQVGALTTWSYVGGGGRHTAAIKTDGTLWTWGRNQFGEGGLNIDTAKSSPTQVGVLTNWTVVSAGYRNTAAIKSDGTLWSWGENDSSLGAVGDGTTIDRSSPVQIGSLTTWSNVGVGFGGTLAITKDP
jgi:alpha-tubulin suppressor-like RCC1 family protein